MQIMNWDDVRFVLAVADEGSLSGAARRLGVNHATVLRRINGFEARIGIAVFERTARGYAVAPRRNRLIEAMRGMEQSAYGIERAITAARLPLAGVVRLTSTDSLCQVVLPQIVALVQDQAEGLTIELNSANLPVSLARMDADITVRPTNSLPAELVGVDAGRLGFAAYAAPNGKPRWLAASGALSGSEPAKWMNANISPEDISGRADSFLVLREMAIMGQGRAILPCVLGDADRRLVRLHGVVPDISVRLWVASHPDFTKVPRIRAVRDLVSQALLRDADRLTGRV